MALVWLGLVLLAALVISAWHSGGSRLRDTGAVGPWIGLPPGGTDLADPQVREMVRQAVQSGSPGSDLLASCGLDPALGRERYVATVTNAQGQDGWRIVFDIHNEDVAVRASRYAFAPAAPSGSAQAPVLRGQTLSRSLRRGQLQEVRDVWRTASLWGDDPGDALGGPGNPTRLEACIDDRYAIRQHPAGHLGPRLHAALVRTLSLPGQ